MIKASILLTRRPDMTREAFFRHQTEIHAPLFLSLPIVQQTVRRYSVQQVIEPNLPGMPQPFDGMAEIWFDDEADLSRCFSDASFQAVLGPDNENFLNLAACQVMITRETLLIDDCPRSR